MCSENFRLSVKYNNSEKRRLCIVFHNMYNTKVGGDVMPIETGDIILVRGKHPIVSSLIRWFTQSEYTHVGMAVDADWIYEIDAHKSLAIHPMTYTDYDVFRYKYGLTREQKEKMRQYATKKAKENQGYDWLRIISFVFEKWFGHHFLWDFRKREICSEIVDEVYASVGIDLVPDRPKGYVRPCDLANSPLLEKVESSTLIHMSS
jgi:uncharacterized protein YycO